MFITLCHPQLQVMENFSHVERDILGLVSRGRDSVSIHYPLSPYISQCILDIFRYILLT